MACNSTSALFMLRELVNMSLAYAYIVLIFLKNSINFKKNYCGISVLRFRTVISVAIDSANVVLGLLAHEFFLAVDINTPTRFKNSIVREDEYTELLSSLPIHLLI